jgi:ATPase family associated with various cellular activities (AAA)
MNIQTFKSIVPILFKYKVVPFVWGAQGVGKTQTLRQIATEMGIGFTHLHMANLEVGDLVGLLVKRDDGTVYHARPEWFPTEGRGIIFLDELNRMHPDVMQAMFSFITSGTIHMHKLPPGWVIAAAGNYSDGDFQVTDTSDAAWMSRFCHIDFKPTIEEFNLFAEKRGAFAMADFFREHPEMLEKSSDKRFNFQDITPDRRTWLDYLFPLDAENIEPETRYEIYQGLVGPSAASVYLTHMKDAEKSLSLKLILEHYESQRAKVLEASKGDTARFDYLNRPVAELIAKLKDNKELLNSETSLNNLKKFLVDIPLELSQRVFKDIGKIAFTNKEALLNDLNFCQQIANKESNGPKQGKKPKKGQED